MRKNLFIPGKMAYVRGEKKPEVDCILCAIVNEDDRVARLEVYRSELSLVTLNLYPYAPGHLMVFPKRHITDPRMLTIDESIDLTNMQSICLNVLDEVYSPHGYNIGYNIGEAGGASIAHLHLHIVPRYRKETGFIDILGGVKIIIEDPNVTLSKMRDGFKKVINSSL
ncbi:TPA: HIT domain-containing protein [Candidatus Poribacteria bacterium]|nr:HIT domain-containing protein [Candidatus Poribacteria bacterium]